MEQKAVLVVGDVYERRTIFGSFLESDDTLLSVKSEKRELAGAATAARVLDALGIRTFLGTVGDEAHAVMARIDEVCGPEFQLDLAADEDPYWHIYTQMVEGLG